MDIIARLPAKAVGRCRCVCKSWRAMLARPEFIRYHFDRSRNLRGEALIFTSYKWKETSFFYSVPLESAHQVFDKITISAKKLSFADCPGSWTRVYVSCDGLLLVGEEMHKTFVLNPTTGEVREVPRWPSALNRWKSRTVYAFGHDSISDDYKIVIVSFCEDFEAEFPTETFVSIYSLKTGTWKNVESPFCWHRDTYTAPGVFVDGSIHWIACTASDYKPTIVAFDIAKEAFCEVPPPPSVVGDMLVCHLLVALGGCLCTYARPEIGGWNVQEDIDIWVMKEYGVRESWIRFTVSGLGASTYFTPSCMLGQEQLVGLTGREGLSGREKLTRFDLKEGAFKDIAVHGIPNKRTLAMNFVESLISPHGTYKTGAE